MTEKNKPKRKRTRRGKTDRKTPTGTSRNKERGLSDAERRFAREFVIDMNGTQACIRAGYSEKTADVQAVRLLGRERVKAEISRLQAAREKKLDLSADRTLLELARIAFFDPREVVDWLTHQVGSVDLPDPDDPEKCNTVNLAHTQVTLKDAKSISADAAAAISEVSQTKDGALKIKFHSKPQALNILARHHGLIIDRSQVDIRMLIGNLSGEQLARYESAIDERIRAQGAQGHIEGTAVEVDERERARQLRPAPETV